MHGDSRQRILLLCAALIAGLGTLLVIVYVKQANQLDSTHDGHCVYVDSSTELG